MLAEHLSGRRHPLPPGFKWRKLRQYLRDLDWYLDRQERLGRTFYHWLRSGDAFVQLSDEDLIPEIREQCFDFKVDVCDIANVLGESPVPTLTPREYHDRARLYWHLCGMPLNVLERHSNLSEESVRISILAAFRKLLGQVGFQVFAHQVDVSCIIGGDLDMPYLKRLLLANGYSRRPMSATNQKWGKCTRDIYIQDPSLLRQVAGTGVPHRTTTLIRVSPRRRSLAPVKEAQDFDPSYEIADG